MTVTAEQAKAAMKILAEAHTKTEILTGFSVSLAPPAYPSYGYMLAWKTVREFLGLPVDPEGPING